MNKKYIYYLSFIILVGCSQKEDVLISYNCVPETYKRSSAIYESDKSFDIWNFSHFGRFVEDENLLPLTDNVPLWLENETFTLNYTQEIWEPDDYMWLNNWDTEVVDKDTAQCYLLYSLESKPYSCLDLNKISFNETTVSATKIYRLIKTNIWLDADFIDNYKPNYFVPEEYDYGREDYVFNRISRKLELRVLFNDNNDKYIDEYTYQCSEVNLSGKT